MAVPVGAIIGAMERIAPRRLALEGDCERVGLAVGSPEDLVDRVLVALDPTPEVVEEAREAKAGLLVTHHPLIFRPLTAVRRDTPVGRVVAEAIANRLAIFCAHTNWDVVEGGVSSVLADRMGLEQVEVLSETAAEPLVKLVVFVPETHAELLRQALGNAGAGHLGRYSHCTFSASGVGTFLPQEGARPFLGEPGRLERVAEVRVEAILPEALLEGALRAVRRVHPYEEVACDVYPLRNRGGAVGLGRLGRLREEMSLADLLELIKRELNVDHVTYIGEAGQRITKVAVCGGAAGELVTAAARRGADVLVAGEVKYHDGLLARQLGLSVVAAGHDATERLAVPALAQRLREEAERLRLEVAVLEAGTAATLWQVG